MENLVNNNFDILKNIDNEELYNKTYISFDNLEAIKDKNFEAFSRFKLMGFIDILSKRLNLDLSEFKIEANQYFDSMEPEIEIEEPKKDIISFNINENRKILISIGIGFVVIVLFVFLYSFFNSDSNNDLTKVQVSPPSDVVIAPPLTVIEEQNTTINTNKTDENVSMQIVKNETPLIQKDEVIKIVPARKIWIGIINLDTKEKHGKTTSEPLEIDTSKNQIIVINGAYLSLMVGDKESKYDHEGRVRFMCKDGKIEEISYSYFKSLNNGKGWD
jgi:hypothetical protein